MGVRDSNEVYIPDVVPATRTHADSISRLRAMLTDANKGQLLSGMTEQMDMRGVLSCIESLLDGKPSVNDMSLALEISTLPGFESLRADVIAIARNPRHRMHGVALQAMPEVAASLAVEKATGGIAARFAQAQESEDESRMVG